MLESLFHYESLTDLKVVLILTSLACLGLLFLRSLSQNLPPGPWGLPIVGYLPFLSSATPYLQLEELRKKYGNVFGMYLGSKYALFLADLESTKEAFNQEVFSGRPDGAFAISQQSTHFGALNEQPWKSRRKTTFQALRQIGVGTKMIEDVSKSEMEYILKKLDEQVKSGKQEIDLRCLLTHATTSVVIKLVCGKTFSPEHKSAKTVLSFLEFFAVNGTMISLDICMPWTKPLLLYLMTRKQETRKIFNDMENFVRAEIASHIANPADTPQDLMDFYLLHYGANRVDDISGDSQIMIFGGADTVRTSTEWFLLCMAQYQEVQEKVFQEINNFYGPDGDPKYEDRDKLPYTEATILESLRFNPLVPLNSYHSNLKDTKFRGYDIPKGSLVFSCLWSLNNNPKYWKKPDQFYPEHFLTPDGGAVKVPEAFVGFALGKRSCVGEKIALIESFVFCVLFLQHFQVLPPDGGVRMEGKLRITLEPSYPIVRLAPRRYP